MSNTNTILNHLNDKLGGERTELAERVLHLFDEHPDYHGDKDARERLRKAIQDLLRPLTNNLRTLVHSPDAIIDSVHIRPTHRLDLLEILPEQTTGETACHPS